VNHWKETLEFFQVVTSTYVRVFVYVYMCMCIYMNGGLAEGKRTYAYSRAFLHTRIVNINAACSDRTPRT